MKQNIPMDIYESKHQDLNPKSEIWDCLEKQYKTNGEEMEEQAAMYFHDDKGKLLYGLPATKVTDTLEALAEKSLDEEFKDRVAIAVLPYLLTEYSMMLAVSQSYDIAELMLHEKKERNNA